MGAAGIRNRLLALFLSGLAALGLVETGARVLYALKVGPSVLLYGTGFHRDYKNANHTVMYHEDVRENYSKYHPHQVRLDQDVDTGEVFRVAINGRGFRGREFSDAKAPGTVRVVTLGASSTFGYHDRDHETYPAYLEQYLNERCPDSRFEVINLGIPHLSSSQIRSLFEAEALPLQPDVVTFYEGVNNTVQPDLRKELSQVPVVSRIYRQARDTLLVVALGDSLVKSNARTYSPEQVAAHMEGKVEAFIEPLTGIAETARARGILFIAAKQQAKSNLVPRPQMRGLRYQDEVRLVRDKLDRQGSISAGELQFLTHDQLMGGLEQWAARNGVPLVDAISAMDQERDHLVSWVHLTAGGNRILADALADEILVHRCASNAVVAQEGSQPG
jgi:lysophospholipase L1-like esterase